MPAEIEHSTLNIRRNRMKVFWLIAYMTAVHPIPQAMHVGTFASMEGCKKAATEAVTVLPGDGRSGPASLYLVCVQASDEQTQPPQ
jgi:hypothetical protein